LQVLETYVEQHWFETFDRTVTVAREGDELFVDIPRDGQSELFAESASTFFIKIRPLQMTFVIEEGRVARIDVVEEGATLRANKIK